MEEIVRKAMLYDFYGELLTPHQRKAYEAVVMDDLSCAELARNENISRQGAHDMIHRCDRQLEEYEEKLHLVERFLNMKRDLQKIRDKSVMLKQKLNAPDAKGADNSQHELLDEIIEHTDELLSGL